MMAIIAIAAHCVSKTSETTPNSVAITPPETPTISREDISFAFLGKCFNAKEKMIANRLEKPNAMITVDVRILSCAELKRSATSPANTSSALIV